MNEETIYTLPSMDTGLAGLINIPTTFDLTWAPQPVGAQDKDERPFWDFIGGVVSGVGNVIGAQRPSPQQPIIIHQPAPRPPVGLYIGLAVVAVLVLFLVFKK